MPDATGTSTEESSPAAPSKNKKVRFSPGAATTTQPKGRSRRGPTNAQRKRRRMDSLRGPTFNWGEVRKPLAALAQFDEGRSRGRKMKESWPLYKKCWMWMWMSKVCYPFRLTYYLIKTLVLDVTGYRPLVDLDKIFVIIALSVTATGLPLAEGATITQQQYHAHAAAPGAYQSRHFTVYDCDDPSTRYVKVDLTTTKPCPDPEADYATPYETQVMVLQSDAKELVDVYVCEAYFTKEVTRCGDLHHSFGTERIAIDERLAISAEECWEWTNTSVYNIPTQHLGGASQQMRLNRNDWAYYDYYSHGDHDKSGYCIWGDWHWAGRHYQKSYEKTMIRARLRKVTGVVNPETNTMTATNLVVNYRDLTVRDGVEGTLVWNNNRRNCTEGVSLLYDGVVSIHRLNDELRKHKADPWAGTIVVMENRADKQTGAFIIKPQKSSCLPDCHLTHIPGLIVCLNPHKIKDLFVYQPGEGSDIKTVMAAVTHTRIAGAFETGKRFGVIQQQLCDISLEGKLHQLSDVAGNNNAYALRRLIIPGVAPRGRKYLPGGAVGYVASCSERNATLFSFPNCTMELPVMLMDNQPNVDTNEGEESIQQEIHFADPITMVISKLPTIVPCSKALPIRWLIQGIWFCADPKITKCDSDAPMQLGTDVDMSGMGPEENDFDPLGAILYSPEQQAENKRYEQSLDSRQPFIQTLVNNMGKSTRIDSEGRIHYGLPFDEAQVSELSWQVMGNAFFFITWMGKYYTAIVGALFLIAVTKLILGIAFRFYVLYRRRGCGIWLVTSFWHTAYLLFGMPWKVARGVYDYAMEEVEKAQEEGLEPCSYDHLSKAVKGLAAGLEQQQALMYNREDKLESFLKQVAGSDHNLAHYARELLDQEGRPHTRAHELNQSQDTPPKASTANKGPDSSQ